MPTPIDWPLWQSYKATIEQCYREGYTPANVSGGKGSAPEEAKRRLQASGQYTGVSRTFVQQWLRIQERRARRGQDHCLPDSSLYAGKTRALEASSRGSVRRWIVTAAQNDTDIHRPFLENLLALSRYWGARLLIGGFTYQVGNVRERAREEGDATRDRAVKWDEAIEPYIVKGRCELGQVLFAAEMNTLPTAVRPLSGLHTYGQGKTCIFPHAKVALESVPAGMGTVAPAVLTTGCVTVESYSDTKAGHKAQFHHILGAVVVEEASDGATFFRHVIARSDGSFQDLDLLVRDGRVKAGERIEAITFGDIQAPFLDPEVALGTWGFDVEAWAPSSTASMIDVLRPRFGFFHDLVDFKSISYHDLKQPRERFATYVAGNHIVARDIDQAARFIKSAGREFMKSVVIESNHDRRLERWLDTADPRQDRENAVIYHRLNCARLEAEMRGDREFNVWRHALCNVPGVSLEGVTFVPEDGSFVICQDTGGIECGTHGHLGPNGGAATLVSLSKTSGKINIGDKHAPGIMEGVYGAGTSSLLRLGYNKGPSSWRHAHIATYASGKRAIIFMDGPRWRA